MRFFIILSFLFPLAAEQIFEDTIFDLEEDDESEQHLRPATCSTPPSPPAETNTEKPNHSITRSATNPNNVIFQKFSQKQLNPENKNKQTKR